MKRPLPFVMLVDDDEVDAFVLRKAFAAGRVAVEFAHQFGGEDVLAYLGLDSARLPDLMLLDVNLPAMDGLQLLRKLRGAEATQTVPVVMFTVSGLEDDVDRAYREGANSYFVKPSSIEDLKIFVDNFDQYWFQCARLPLRRA